MKFTTAYSLNELRIFEEIDAKLRDLGENTYNDVAYATEGLLYALTREETEEFQDAVDELCDFYKLNADDVITWFMMLEISY